MSLNGKRSSDDNRRWSYCGSINSLRQSVSSNRGSYDNDSLMELTDESVIRLLDRAIDHYDNSSTMSSRRNLPQTPTQTIGTNGTSPLPSRSAIEDLFHVFENNAEFITMGKRLLNKKRKLEQLRAQLNLPEKLTNEDTVKLLQLRERLKAKRRLPTAFIEPEKLTTINRKSSNSMPDLTPTPLTDTTNQSSLFDLNASLNSSVYRKRRRKSLFRSTLTLTKQVGPEFVVKPNSKIEKIIVPSRNPFECICQVIVLLPNNTRVQISCKSDATVRIIFETIITYVDLIEHNLFGLTILIDSEYCFPPMDLKVSKLINDSKWKLGQMTFVMQLKIKYFVNDITLLRHFLTQHFFYLQFRQMILADTYQITNEQKFSFATLAFQAEYGDSIDNERIQTEFIVEHYVSNDLINEYGTQSPRQEIVKRQRFYLELNDVQAERMFVENVMKLDDYGYHMYKLYRDLKRDDIYLVGIRLRDISIWQLKNRQRQTKITYDWDQIERIAFDKRTFSIILKRQLNDGKIKYLTNNSKKGKYLFELCYDTYAYTKSILLRHNSRYSLLNEPIGEIEFIRNGSDADSVDLNSGHSRSQSHENLNTIGKNTSPNIIVYEVDLYKDHNNSLGMSLMGESTSGIFIKSIHPSDGSAARSGKIHTGDRLLSINGKTVNGLTVQEVAEALSLSSNPCRLKLSRQEISTSNRRDFLRRPMSVDADSLFQQKQSHKHSSNRLSTTWSNENLSKTLPPKRVLSNESILTQASDLSSTRDIKSAVFPVTIDRSGHGSLGFHVVGGLDSEIEDHGIYVKSITPGSAASRSELLLEGDKILEVNGSPLTRVTHSEAVDLFRRATGLRCHLLVQRLIFPNHSRLSSSTNGIYPFARSENTFEVTLNRGHTGLGLSLFGGAAENRPVEIIDIYPNQPAALSDQLEIGDVILSINDVPMHNRNVRDVPSIIGESIRNIKLVVCRPDRREYKAYLERHISQPDQSARPTLSGSMNNEQSQFSIDVVRDLPPKSPGTKRVMPTVLTKVKRGEDQSATSNSFPPSPVIPTKSTKTELVTEPVQYEKIQILLPKASQGTYGIGLSQIDPQEPRGGIFICALQRNGVAEKDGRLQIDDRLLCINDQNTNQMTYREVIEVLKSTTKKGVSLLIARPISTDSPAPSKTNVISDKEISTIHQETPAASSTSPGIVSSIMEKLTPREKPKLLPIASTEKSQASTTPLSSDSIDVSSSSSTATPAPSGSALQALLGKKIKPLPPTHLDTTTEKNEINAEKKKDSPGSNTDPEEESSEIKTPAMSPRSPVAPLPTVLELNVPPTPSKPLTTSQANDIAKRTQYYQQAASNEILILNAGVAEKVENLTMQLIDKISTPAITMDTATLMDECREIDIKIESEEYLEEFRALKTINEHEPVELIATAMRSENKALNRFQNIVPYDFNRVVLSTKPDYINASHIAIPIGEKSMKYIISPPPVPDSINDFWQMIGEQRIRCIVGIFTEQDLKKMKCPTYWPATTKTTMTFSPFLSLTLMKQRQLDGIDIKEFLLRITEQASQKQEHAVVFLTYTKWPMDDNIPNETQTFLSLIHLAHSYQTTDVPLLIHCNTGVGRTGCTLLISLLVIKMIRGRTLDIYAMAKECRRQRSGMIQTEQQYRYIYECARDALNMAIEHSIMQSAH